MSLGISYKVGYLVGILMSNCGKHDWSSLRTTAPSPGAGVLEEWEVKKCS